ncbi:MAG: MBL fold metallo-hydrolase [Oscillospiraceae bacterium]|nr:MBL fold metallo-hydrolase [Oscillospiraceae bacterium]
MFEKISEHCYYRPAEPYTDRPNIGYILGKKYSLLFEAGNSESNAKQLKSELSEQNLPLPDYVAVSHWHWDHSFGLHAWDCLKIAGEKTNKKLLEVSKWKWDESSMEERIRSGEDIVFCTEMIKREYPDRNKINVIPADISFENRMSISLGEVSCELLHCGGPHSEDSVLCFIPEEKVLFLGDSNCKDLYEKTWHFDIEHEEDFLENVSAIPYDTVLVEKFISVLNGLDFEICITGHGGFLSRDELYSSLK